MRDYELVLVVNPELTSEKSKKLLSQVKKWVINAKGEVVDFSEWGKKDLAYPLKGQSKGLYFLGRLTLPAASPAALEAKLKLEEEIWRYLLVRAKKEKKKKKISKKTKEVKNGPKSS